MSLLTMCQNVADEIGLLRPASTNLTTIISNTEETAVTLLTHANREGKTLAKRHPWSVLTKQKTTVIVSGTSAYALPSDFDRFVSLTLWDRSQKWIMEGPVSPQRWQYFKSGLSSVTIRTRFRVKPSSTFAKQLHLDPKPTASANSAYEYVSTFWCQSSAGVSGRVAWANDADKGVLDEYLMELGLKWRMLNVLGMPYLEAKEEYDAEVDKAIAQDGFGSPVLRLSRSDNNPLLGVNLPDVGFGS